MEMLRLFYEGRVKSSGSSEEIAVVLPSMIEALFKDFSGHSGETKKNYDRTSEVIWINGLILVF